MHRVRLPVSFCTYQAAVPTLSADNIFVRLPPRSTPGLLWLSLLTLFAVHASNHQDQTRATKNEEQLTIISHHQAGLKSLDKTSNLIG